MALKSVVPRRGSVAIWLRDGACDRLVRSRDFRLCLPSPGSASVGKVFVRDFIEVARPFEEVAPRLVRDTDWLNPIVHDALEQVREGGYSTPVDGPAGDGVAPTAVHCVRGLFRIRADSLVVSLHWDIDPPGGVLPVLDGDLEVAPLGERRSQVSLSAYCPPFGRTDPARQRGAEVAMRAFLERLAAFFTTTS